MLHDDMLFQAVMMENARHEMDLNRQGTVVVKTRQGALRREMAGVLMWAATRLAGTAVVQQRANGEPAPAQA